MTRSRTAAAALVAAAVGAALWGLAQVALAPPAHAAACPGSSGVTVVTDFAGLGGGVQGACVGDGGGDTATSLFPAAGFPLRYASRQPGFVCRVSEKPTTDPCVNTAPADAYWGLWWSDGTDGRWTYSSLGAGSLRIPDGGYVGFAWDDVAGQPQPGFPPTARSGGTPSAQPTSTSPPTDAPSPQPPGQPSNQPTAQSTQTPPPASPTTQPTTPGASSAAPPTALAPTDGPRSPRPSDARSSPSGPPSPTMATTNPEADLEVGSDATKLADPVTSTTADTEAAQLEDNGLPGWLAPLVIVLLFAIAGVVLLLQRRRGTSTP